MVAYIVGWPLNICYYEKSELLCGYYIERSERLYHDGRRRNFVCIAHRIYNVGFDGACNEADAT